MLTLLGSLLGFLSSTFPEFLKLFRDSQDRKHELAILDRQMEQQRLGHSQRLEEIQIAADVAESQALYSYANHPSNSPWVEALQASVRPVITYAFFLVFAVVKVSALATLLQTDGITLAAALQTTWDEETQALFAAVMSFWFGSRQISKMRRGWLMRHVTEEGINLIKRFEGFSPTIYICPGGYPTIGYGHVVLAHEQDQFAKGITQAEATELLRKDVGVAERAVLRLISVTLTDGQFDALVSFTFNLGAGALQRSTLRRKVNRGEHRAVPAELMKWVWAAGKRMPGLVRRRKAEALAYS